MRVAGDMRRRHAYRQGGESVVRLPSLLFRAVYIGEGVCFLGVW